MPPALSRHDPGRHDPGRHAPTRPAPGDGAPVIVWFRRDLRLADNPALAAAAGRPVLPLFVLDEEAPGRWRPGGASRWWLHHSLAALAASLARLGLPLLLRRGPAARVVPALAAETGAAAVHWNRRYEPWAVARDAALKAELAASGVGARSFNGSLLAEPWQLSTGAGRPYRVFTPFWRALLAAPPPAPPLPVPAGLTAPAQVPRGDRLEDWGLLPSGPDWAGGLRDTWTPGEAGAAGRLARFLEGPAAAYGAARDLPGTEGTSRLSPHLHFGEISPRQVWAQAQAAMGCHDREGMVAGIESFLREIGWREFCYNLLYHFPTLPEVPLNPEFEAFPWSDDRTALSAWTRGRTGYPIVDAGMRQLWATGWMHNRVRMIAASFLVKHLLLPWREGAAWFWDTLVDADLANNSAGWQWVAGCGADAAPYFRVFNPVLQGRKFDPAGAYVRRWVPELARLPDAWVHEPWRAPADVLARAGVRPGRDYPEPVVALEAGRERALAAYATLGQAS
ncbi:MAG TPA: deoxyribodipyrimidine photo-lyase [Azospirillaceae bacterium]|nr:deoxyribodipyrimidine photo-lyase [Azospirillaceae bacterium]